MGSATVPIMIQPPNSPRPGWPRLFAVISLILALAPAAVAGNLTPVTPGASGEAQGLLNYFTEIYGKQVIAGQHDGWRLTNGLSEELHYITNTTGKLPALLEMDLGGYTGPDPATNHDLMRHALDWWQRRHGIVAFCCHWRAPMNAPAFYTKDTTFDIARAVTPGTPEYAATERNLDSLAAELEMLQSAHVPVLWRPLHEANGRWFWWGAGGPEPFKRLWRLMFENFTVKHHLNNLLWVFSPGAETDLAEWYPGDAYVDIIGQDHYPMDGNHGSAKDVFDELTQMTRGQKLIALGENGPIPDPARMRRDHAPWLYFTTWAGSILYDKTSPDELRAYYHNPYVLTLADLPDFKNFSTKAPGPACQLGFVGTPGDVAVDGTWRMPVCVAVQDGQGKIVRDGVYAVHLALNHRAAADVRMSGPLTATTVNGIATFSGIRITAAVDACRLVATAAGLAPATSAPFAVGPGNGLRRIWRSGADTNVPPVSGSEILGTALETPVRWATNFSARITGELIAPQSGDYQFWIADAGRSELWLGTDESAAGKHRIGGVTGATPYQKWPHINEAVSDVVTLQAGRKYFFELRQWQPQGSTQLHVGWQLPDGTRERPIPAYRFLTGAAASERRPVSSTRP
jgi:mannan endo-1,4-beta-mannosidase